MQFPAAVELATDEFVTDETALLAIDEFTEDFELLLEDLILLATELVDEDLELLVEDLEVLATELVATELLEDLTLLDEAAPTIP